jgi:hypothetical protein
MTAGDHAAGLRSEKLDPIRQAVRRAPALHRVYLFFEMRQKFCLVN